jgi:threonine dehydratase
LTTTEKAGLSVPTLTDVLAAARTIRPHLSATPLRRYPALGRLLGAETWVKHENHQPTGAFKVRGGVNLVSQLSEEERRTGVIAASTGNHGQSIAYGARLFGVPAVICVPRDANPVKVESIRDLGGRVVEHGRDYDEAREHSEQLAAAHGYRYVHSGDEPLLIAGVATLTLEILQEEPEIDAILIPIGGGSGAAGACIAGKALSPELAVIGVQAEQAPAAYRSWRTRSLLGDETHTFAEGLATRTAFALPQRILWELLDDFVLVSDDEIRAAVARMIETTRTLVEPAGAAALAGALRLRDRLDGHRVALIASGGNITLPQLRAILAVAS